MIIYEVGPRFQHNIVTVYKNPSNLRKNLVHSKLSADYLSGTFPCGRAKCEHIVIVTTVEGPSDSFKVKRSFSCTSSNLIYAIICIKCGELDIGQTQRRLGDRFREHLGHIRRYTPGNDVAHHFNSHGHNINISITGLCFEAITHKRERLESRLIRKLNMLVPLGMNQET